MKFLKVLFRGKASTSSHAEFFIPEPQYEQMMSWIATLDTQVLEEQRRTMPEKVAMMGGDTPYVGCTGGGITFEFTPSKSDVSLKVTHTLTDAELALRFQKCPRPKVSAAFQVFDTRTCTDQNLSDFIKGQRALLSPANRQKLGDAPEIAYRFKPTSIGKVLVLRHLLTGQEKDVSDYDSW